MSKWSHIFGIIKWNNTQGLLEILSEQILKENPSVHYINPYLSLKGSEGDVEFRQDEDELKIIGNLRDVDGLLADKEQIIKDFKEIIQKVDGKGYIEIEYEFEGTTKKVIYQTSPLTGWKFAIGKIMK